MQEVEEANLRHRLWQPTHPLRHQRYELYPAAWAWHTKPDLLVRPLPTDQLWWQQHPASSIHASPTGPGDHAGPTDLAATGHPCAADLALATEEEQREGAMKEVAISNSAVGAVESAAADTGEV